MSKFIFVADPHVSSTDIATRVDKTSETILKKIEYILDQAAEMSAPVVFTGDFLNSNSNTTPYLLEVINLFNSKGIACYTIGGNHECRGDSFASYDYSQIQFFFRANVLTYLDSNVQDIVIPEGIIRGYSAYSKLNTSKADKVVGLVVHHFLIDSFDDPLVLYPNQAKQLFPNLKFIVAGHDHAYYPISYTPDGVALVRPGSLLRRTSADHNNRKPLFAVLDTTDFSFTYHEVPAAKFSSLFTLESKKTEKDASKLIDKFALDMRTQLSAGINLEETMQARLEKVEDPATQSVIREDLLANEFIRGEK